MGPDGVGANRTEDSALPANARTNLMADRLIVERSAAAWPPGMSWKQLGVLRFTAPVWLHRYDQG